MTIGGAGVVTLKPVKVPPPSCDWYTPMIGKAAGQVVTVAITGPGCKGTALIRWVSLESGGKPWASTSIALGTLIAQLEEGGTTVRIWQQGSALPTDQTAGELADAFEAAGWTPQYATCGLPDCGPPITPPESSGPP
jgi:hypothetical protein